MSDETLAGSPGGDSNLPKDDHATVEFVSAMGGAGGRGAGAGDASAKRPTTQADSFENPGDEIGPFKLVTQIGEGGFGTVWLAQRREQFDQRVALKLIKAGMDSVSVLGRFEQERQALAVMNHPNVAKVLDGGVTPSGRPYFAMEYVKGAAISDFCDERKLDIRARLELFVQVCDAVQHAHTKGIIHRDLKPGNVLVATEGDRPIVKVIDFGVAKALHSRMSEHTIFTETGQMIGTPAYMSPEQAEPDENDIDTRSDVYSLGVMLYELLTGALPFESTELRGRAYRELQRIIREEDPPSPSRRFSTVATHDTAAASKIAAARKAGVAALAATLKNELEWIPLKAMRKDRAERYTTPNDMAQDLRNYLGGLPLVAAPESRRYRARKFIRRHRLFVGAGAAVAASLLIGAIVSTMFGIAERRARLLSEQRERDVQSVLAFQIRQLSEFGGGTTGAVMASEIMRQVESRGTASAAPPAFREELRQVNFADVASSLVRQVILSRSVEWADREHAADPFVHAGLLMSIGRAYEQLGDVEHARQLFRRAHETYQSLLGAEDRRTLAARVWIARCAANPVEAEAELRLVMAIQSAALGPAHADTLETRQSLAHHLDAAGKFEEARREYEAVVEAVAATSTTALMYARVNALASVGELFRRQGRLADAERVCTQAQDDVARITPTPERLNSKVLTNLGLALTELDDPTKQARGLQLLNDALALDESFYGETHPLAFQSRASVAATLRKFDDGSGAGIAKAVEAAEHSRVIGASLVAPPDEYYHSLVALALMRTELPTVEGESDADRLVRSITVSESALAALTARRAGDTEIVRGLEKSLAWMYLDAGRSSDAERLLIDLRARWLKVEKPASLMVLDLSNDLADAVWSQGRKADAVAILVEAQAAGADPVTGRDDKSDIRWKLAVKLRDRLKEWGASEPDGPARARLTAQQATVDQLREARKKSGKSVDADVVG